RTKSRELSRVQAAQETKLTSGNPTAYLELGEDNVSGTFTGIENVVDIPVTRINVQKIVEFYSKFLCHTFMTPRHYCLDYVSAIFPGPGG
ncbi:MAG: hypothetical protein GY940_02220, partial [bacterium]|nr:hypothetical protein [bacterium]